MQVWELHSNGPGSRRGPVTAPEKWRVQRCQKRVKVSMCFASRERVLLTLVQWHISMHVPFSPEVANNPGQSMIQSISSESRILMLTTCMAKQPKGLFLDVLWISWPSADAPAHRYVVSVSRGLSAFPVEQVVQSVIHFHFWHMHCLRRMMFNA